MFVKEVYEAVNFLVLAGFVERGTNVSLGPFTSIHLIALSQEVSVGGHLLYIGQTDYPGD